MSNIDWSKFTVRINVRARRSDLYDAWTTKAGMEYWFLRNCEFVDAKGYILDEEETIRAGCTYTFFGMDILTRCLKKVKSWKPMVRTGLFSALGKPALVLFAF